LRLRSPSRYLVLGTIVLVGAILRFWHLDGKPLWADEILTALFSLGRSPSDLPLNALFSQFHLTFNPDATCGEIARNVAVESTHPPLFFCLTHSWIGAIDGFFDSLAWQMRSLSALFGVGAIVAVFALNYIAFSPTSGLIAASLMAVSPFCVYLSQEARHYTLPLFLVAIALSALIWVIQNRQHRLVAIVVWIAANSIGLYIHYFFILAYGSQVAIVFSLLILRWQFFRDRANAIRAYILSPVNGKAKTRQLILPLLRGVRGDLRSFAPTFVLGGRTPFAPTVFLPLLVFIPWLPTLIEHFNRPETDWFVPFTPHWTDIFAPIFQTIAAWIAMVVVPPIEGRSLWVAVPFGIAAIAFFIWFVHRVWQGYKQLWRQPETRLSTFILTSFTAWVLLAYFAIVYILGKDITVAPRYHFLYYPSLCAIAAASLCHSVTKKNVGVNGVDPDNKQHSWKEGDRAQATPTPLKTIAIGFPSLVLKEGERRSPLRAIAIGFLSSVLIVNNGAFYKPYYPDRVAADINIDPSRPAIVATGYQDLQEVALGLSFVLEIEKLDRNAATQFAFWPRSPQYDRLWLQLSQTSPFPVPFDVWVVGPGLRQAAYPDRLSVGDRHCQRDPQNYHRIGIPYQLYRCPGRQETENPSTIEQNEDRAS